MLSLVIVFSSISVSAQSAPNPNAQVRVYPAQAKTSTVETFAPGDPEPKDKQDYFSGLTVMYSPDGKWIGTYGLQEGSTTPQIFYGQVGQPLVKATIPDQSFPNRITFSRDSHYLGYTVLNFTTQQWTMGVVDLTNGKSVQFTGKSSPGPVIGDATPDLNVVQGMALPVSWSPDGKLMYIESFVYTQAAARHFDGLYSLDFSALDFTQSDAKALPATTRLLQDAQIYGEPVISPDGTQALYLSNDPQNPPENYTPTKFSQTANTLSVVDLGTGKSSAVSQAPKGQAMATVQWMSDGKSILYTAGGFQNTSYIVDPHAYLLDLASGKADARDALGIDAGAYLVNMLVCGDNLFYLNKVYKDDFSGDTILYSAPLSDLKSRSKALVAAQNITLMRCVS
jgi:Tol biopolymer transport system component